MQKILGFNVPGGMACLIHDNRDSYTASIEEAIKRRAVEEFDKTCSHSGQHGLSALAVGTAHLGQILPTNLSMIMRARATKTKRLSIEVPGQSKSPLISISLRSMHAPKVHATGSLTSEESPYRFTTVLNAAVYSEPQLTTSISSTLLPAREEMNFLHSTSNMVFSRLCSDMQFASPLAACRNFAEALLRVLRFRTPYLSMASVKLLAESTSGAEKEYIVQATWRDPIDVVTSFEDTKKRQVNVAVIKDGIACQDNAGIGSQSDPNDAEVADSTGSPDSKEPYSWSRKILQSTKKHWRHLDSVSTSHRLVSELKSHGELYVPWPRYQAFADISPDPKPQNDASGPLSCAL